MILSSSGIMEAASVDAWMDAGVLTKRPKGVFLDWKDYSSWLMSNHQIGRCTWFCQHTGMPTKTPRMSFRIIPGVMYDLLSDGGFIPNRRYVKWAFRARNGSFGRPSPCHPSVGCCKHPFHKFIFHTLRYFYAKGVLFEFTICKDRPHHSLFVYMNVAAPRKHSLRRVPCIPFARQAQLISIREYENPSLEVAHGNPMTERANDPIL